MPELTERQRKILLLVVREYIDSAQPVSSSRLVRKYQLGVSSATVRNELSALTEMGYLRQPHTSAGRVPTEDGYRFFVADLLDRTELPASVREAIRHEFRTTRPDLERWMRVAAAVLARQAHSVSLVTSPHAPQTHFKHVELIATQGRQVLMVLVLGSGEVLQRLLTLPEPVPQKRLSRVAAELNELLSGLSLEQMEALRVPSEALMTDVLTWVKADIRTAELQQTGEIYLDGLSHMLSLPDFNRPDGAGRTLRLIEEKETLRDLLTQATEQGRVGNVQVLIGSNADRQILQQCALVLSRYGVPGQATGAVGVLGPMRMPYGRAIPVVRYVSGVLSNLVNEIIVGEDDYEQAER